MLMKLRFWLLMVLLCLPAVLQAQDGECPGDLPPRLVVGAGGRVLPGEPNNVRIAPSTGSTILNQIPAGGVFTVLEGPTCVEEMAWWRVNYAGVEGWTAEGQRGEYWLEPLTPITVENAAQLTPFMRLGWGGWTSNVAWSPDGQTIAVGGTLGIWLFDANAMDAPPRLLEGHEKYVWHAAFSPDSQILASAGCSQLDSQGRCAQEETYLWNVETGSQMRVIQHDSHIRTIRFSPDGRRLAAVAADTLELWDVQTGERVLNQSLSNPYISAIAFSPNSQILAYQNSDSTFLWDAAKNIQIRLPEGLASGAAAIAFSPDGQVLAVSGERRIDLWDINRSVVIGQYDNMGGVDDPECVYGCVPTDGLAYTTDMAFSPDGSLLVSANDTGTLTVWTVQGSGAEMRLELSKVVGGFDYHYATSMAFSPDGTRVITNSLTWDGPSDNRLKLWDVRRGELLATYQEGHTNWVSALAFSPDGTRLASGGGLWDGTLRVWDVATGRQQLVMNQDGNEIRAVQFSPDGSLIASLSEHAIGEGSRMFVRLWDAEGGEPRRAAIGGGWFQYAYTLALSPDGNLLASDIIPSGDDMPVSVWEIDDLLQASWLEDEGYYSNENSSMLTALAFSPGGDRLATLTYDGTVQFWDVQSRSEVSAFRVDSDLAEFLVFSPDGLRIAVGGCETRNQDTYTCERGGVWIWDVRSATQQAFLEHAVHLNGLAFSPDSNLIASTGDGLRLWNATNGALLATFTDAGGPVAFSPDSMLLATGGEGNTVVLWHIPSL